jgi:hypothetical protein
MCEMDENKATELETLLRTFLDSSIPNNPNTNGQSKNVTTVYTDGTPKVPRPPNSFMVYRKIMMPQIRQDNAGINNREVSRICGLKWHKESQETRQKYAILSMELKRLHNVKYPDYRYRPRPRRAQPRKQLSDDVLEYVNDDAKQYGVGDYASCSHGPRFSIPAAGIDCAQYSEKQVSLRGYKAPFFPKFSSSVRDLPACSKCIRHNSVSSDVRDLRNGHRWNIQDLDMLRYTISNVPRVRQGRIESLPTFIEDASDKYSM